MAAAWTNDQIERLAKSLVRCDAMKHPGNRDSVVERLENINDGIARKDNALEDTVGIVRRCAQSPEWMDALMKAIGFRDKGTIFFTNAEMVLETIEKELNDMGETPALPDEANVITPVGEDKTVETPPACPERRPAARLQPYPPLKNLPKHPQKPGKKKRPSPSASRFC